MDFRNGIEARSRRNCLRVIAKRWYGTLRLVDEFGVKIHHRRKDGFCNKIGSFHLFDDLVRKKSTSGKTQVVDLKTFGPYRFQYAAEAKYGPHVVSRDFVAFHCRSRANTHAEKRWRKRKNSTLDKLHSCITVITVIQLPNPIRAYATTVTLQLRAMLDHHSTSLALAASYHYIGTRQKKNKMKGVGKKKRPEEK